MAFCSSFEDCFQPLLRRATGYYQTGLATGAWGAGQMSRFAALLQVLLEVVSRRQLLIAVQCNTRKSVRNC